MAHYIIAGKPDDPEFAEAECLGYHLESNLPDFHVQVQMIEPTTWDPWLTELYSTKKWDERKTCLGKFKSTNDLNQVVWRKSGQLVGNAKDFILLMNKMYRAQLPIDPALLSDIANENYDHFWAKKHSETAK